MAISKLSRGKNQSTTSTNTNDNIIIQNTNNNTPEVIENILENNPDHQSSAGDLHAVDFPGYHMYSSFDEAKNACDLIYLKPGEAHTEFYKINDEYHCVVAIGNLNSDNGHLYLTDSGENGSLDDRLAAMNAQVILLSKQFTLLSKDVSSFKADIEQFVIDVNNSLNDIRRDIQNFETSVSSEIRSINANVDSALNRIGQLDEQITQQVRDISTLVSNFDPRITKNSNDITVLNTSVNNLKQSVLYNSGQINDILIRLENIDASIDTNVDSINHDINDIVITVHSQAQQLNSVNQEINDINNTIIDVSSRLANTDSNIEDIQREIDNINSSINNINDTLVNINNSIFVINNQLDGNSRNISDIYTKIGVSNTSIYEINLELTNVKNDINNLNNIIQTESNRNNVQDISINALDSSIRELLYIVNCRCQSIEEIILHQLQQDASIRALDSSIKELRNEFNELTPIPEDNIYPLFHNDIYTINLCCYTEAGHIEINDHIAGVNAGGTNTRVAECTPFNEYKTYIQGDTVDFTAVANKGYRFMCWYKDAQINNPIKTQPISYTFGGDINVIGSLLDGVEPDILQRGYTAKFMKLRNLKVVFNQITNNIYTVAKFFNDTLNITITDIDGTRTVDIEDAIQGNVYFVDHARIVISAVPDSSHAHEFEKYIITLGNITSEYGGSTYVNSNVESDIIINAYFMEYWVKLSVDASPQEAGGVTPSYEPGTQQISIDRRYIYYLADSKLLLWANANHGYGLRSWTTANNHPVLSQFEHDIQPYVLTDNPIILNINKNVEEYELAALYDSGVTSHVVIYYYDNTYRREFARQRYEDGSILTAPEGVPTKQGYTFDHWVCEEPGEYIFDITPVKKDLRFYANWGEQIYDVSFYVNDEQITERQVPYETPLYALNVQDPEVEGYEFKGWMVDSSLVNNSYLIIDNTRFDASLLIETYNVDIIVLGNTSTYEVEYNTEFGDIKPEDPSIEGLSFNGWAVNSSIIGDEYKIIEDTSVIAEFDTKYCNIEFIVDSSVIDSSIVEWNTAFLDVKPAEDPSKEGYTFNYWTINGTPVSEEYYRIKTDSSFIANFTINTYDVIFNDEGYQTPVNVNYNEVIPSESIPEFRGKTGYDASGWANNDGFTIESPITKNTVFTADYVIKTFDVSFYSDSSLVKEDTVEYNTEFRDIKPADPYKDGYTFNYWLWNNSDTSVLDTDHIIENSIFNASYSINRYTVDFIVDGNIYDSSIVDWNTEFGNIKPEDPSKSGYIFRYWEINDVSVLDSSRITNDTTVYAKFDELIYHDVTFWLEPDVRYTFIEDVIDGSTLGELRAIIGDPSKEGYNFNGWMINDVIKDDNYSIIEDTSFYASFSRQQFTTWFDLNNETGSILQIQAQYGDTLGTLGVEDPTYPDHIFAAWQVNGVDVTNSYPIVEDTSFVARYDAAPAGDTYMFIGFDLGTTNRNYGLNAETRAELKDILNRDADGRETNWVDTINSDTATIYWNSTSASKSYCSYRISSGSNNGTLSFDAAKNVKLLLGKYGSSENTTARIDINGVYTEKDQLALISNDFYNNYINTEVDLTTLESSILYNIIDIQAGDSIKLYPINGGSNKRRFDIVGVFIKSTDVNLNNVSNSNNLLNSGLLGGVLLGSNNSAIKNVAVFNEGLNGDDYEIQVNNGDTLLEPTINMQKQGYTFNGWDCITDPTFEFGVTPVEQDLEFEPIWVKNNFEN